MHIHIAVCTRYVLFGYSLSKKSFLSVTFGLFICESLGADMIEGAVSVTDVTWQDHSVHRSGPPPGPPPNSSEEARIQWSMQKEYEDLANLSDGEEENEVLYLLKKRR